MNQGPGMISMFTPQSAVRFVCSKENTSGGHFARGRGANKRSLESSNYVEATGDDGDE
jgi:hypothetical protein